ncbi:MAG: DUF5689 domain-containing protein [Alistipes sp.]
MLRFLFAITTLFLSGCYDTFDTPDTKSDAPPSNVTISALRKLYAGKTFKVENDLTLSGFVTSSDEAGNFFRTFTLEDNGAGIEIMAGIDYLQHSYPIGHKVTVHLKDLAVGQSYGVLQVGRMPQPASGFTTDYIGSKAALDGVAVCTDENREITPLATDITALTPDQCGTLVRISGLKYTPSELDPLVWAGYKTFADTDGHMLYVYTRTYADFAGHEVPLGTVSLTGILQHGKAGSTTDGYMLKLRSEEDCTQ